MIIMRRTIINKPNEKADSGRRKEKKRKKKKHRNTEEKLKTIIERVSVCLSAEATGRREARQKVGSNKRLFQFPCAFIQRCANEHNM